MRRVLLFAALAFAIAAGTIAFSPQKSASAHASVALASACVTNPSIANCDNQDPTQSGCTGLGTNSTIADWYVHNSSGTAIIHIEMRYNSYCKSRWTRLTGLNGATYNMQAKISRIGNNSVTFSYGPVTANVIYGNMVYAPYDNTDSFWQCGSEGALYSSSGVFQRSAIVDWYPLATGG